MLGAGLLGIVFLCGVLALGVAAWFSVEVLRRDQGTPKMRAVSDAIREGANAFLRRQYKTIAIFALCIAALLAVVYGLTGRAEYALTSAVGFLIGAVCSALAGVIGMMVSVRTNLRVASAARRSLKDAVHVALRGGAVSGILVVTLSLLGVGVLYLLFGADPRTTPLSLVGFAFGASFVALFAQLGGGIYTKAADVGADIVGKIEKDIPEDDHRNPAVIADLVGDNVGDCAGRGADLFESTAAENIGAMILGVALYPVFGVGGVLFPLVARALGLLASIVGILSVRIKGDEHPMRALNHGYLVAGLLSALSFYAAASLLLRSPSYPLAHIAYFLAGLVGIVTSVLLIGITQYYTEYRYRPVREIVHASRTGPGTNVITGLSVGMESTLAPVIVIIAALLGSYHLGVWSGVPGGGLYGTAVAVMGMLATAAYVLSMDTFGPITDNAGGIVEMSGERSARERTDRLDAVGNTTKALTKGYAIGSAALAAFLLFSAYLDEVSGLAHRTMDAVNFANVHVFAGALAGAMLVFFFSALAIRAVGTTAECIINDVRRQFDDGRIMRGKAKPNYAACVDITTRGALREMVLPGLVAIAVPLVVGLFLRAEAVAALLMSATITGILLATLLNNSGGAWDNAKKHIESIGRKGSDAHKAAVVGDTVGDPCKDTAGPSLHVLIKFLATVTLVLAPLFV